MKQVSVLTSKQDQLLRAALIVEHVSVQPYTRCVNVTTRERTHDTG